MGIRSRYVQIFRRRREGKTDYRKRKGIILGRKPFLSVHISGRYVSAQISRPTAAGDVTLCSTSSRSLPKFGWKGSPKNVPGAYLTGYCLGKLAAQKKLNEAVAYSGVGRFVHGSRIASLISGARDAGLHIEMDEESLPEEARIKGQHIAAFAKTLESEDKERFDRLFSGLKEAGFHPADYPANFDSVKSSIANSLDGSGKA